MNRFTLSAAAALGLLTLSAVSAHASFHDSPVRLAVKVNGGDSHDRIKGSTAVQHDQTKELDITVSSVSKTVPSGLRLKWFMYGRDIKSNGVSVLRSGEAKVALGSNGSQVISTAKVETKSTPEHSVVSKGRRGGSNGSNGSNGGTGGGARISVKKVEATGDKYIGYGVQVLAGNKVVSETFDPPGVKGSLSSKSYSSSN